MTGGFPNHDFFTYLQNIELDMDSFIIMARNILVLLK